MSPAVANFIFEAANFVLLAAVLGWVLFRPVRRALDAERERHAKMENDAKQLREEAQRLAEEARVTRESASREAHERGKQLLASAQAEASRVLQETRDAIQAERHAFEEELAAMRHADAADLANMVGRIAADSVRQLLDAVRGPSLDLALVRSACAELRCLPDAARRTAVVEVACELDPEASQLLASVLGNVFEPHIVAELGAGVRVTTPAGQVDASAASFARRAARNLSAGINERRTRADG